MRVALLLGPLLAVGLLTACTDRATHVDGAAVPITTSPSATPSTSIPPPTTPATSAPATPTHQPGGSSSAPVKNSTFVLGPNGLGALKLGMSSKAATATGLIRPWSTGSNSTCALMSHLKASGSTGDGLVEFSTNLGVEVIGAYGDLRTPEGIHLGSSRAAVRKAYPDWPGTVGGNAPAIASFGFADVRGNNKARYAIAIRDGKVGDLGLEYNKQDCSG